MNDETDPTAKQIDPPQPETPLAESPQAKTPQPESPLPETFEACLEHLNAAVRRLEGADLDLEEAMAVYERGVALARRCQTLLAEAELRVSQLGPEADEDLGP